MAENNSSTKLTSKPAAKGKISREERLAAKLRENLRRRKHQAKAMGADDHDNTDNPAVAPPTPALSKTDASG